MTQTGLFWFTNDLRLHDQTALWQLANRVDRLICVYCIDPEWFKPNGLNSRAMGQQRYRFLLESLADLQTALAELGQQLLVLEQSPVEAISQVIERHQIRHIGRSAHPGIYEQRQWQSLQRRFPTLRFLQTDTFTLFHQEDLPFRVDELPKSFSQFRRKVDALQVPAAQKALTYLPPPPEMAFTAIPIQQKTLNPLFKGGEAAALTQLTNYFSSDAASQYKQTRNALDGWLNSTRFSPWLANGCLSVRHIHSRLRQYERQQGANESTEWIFVELLWREYFQWYAIKHGYRLFTPAGITQKPVRCCFYPERYQRWCHGNTPYPLVNALMHELNDTGYMSNRGRQIVASAFIHELRMDWRYGAAYFEQQLIDYDMASNWGNWQYIAGVGADPRGGRHFNLHKQTQEYDPEGSFIRTWQGGEGDQPLDSLDAADWPIMPPPQRP